MRAADRENELVAPDKWLNQFARWAGWRCGPGPLCALLTVSRSNPRTDQPSDRSDTARVRGPVRPHALDLRSRAFNGRRGEPGATRPVRH